MSPERVSTGQPAHSASLPVVCALYGQVSRNRSARRYEAQVLGVRARRREDQAPLVDAPRGRLASQVRHRGVVVATREEPQHGARNALENRGPCVHRLGPQLPGRVEVAQHDGIVRKAELGPRRRLDDRAVAVVDLVATGQPHQGFGVVRRVRRRRDDGVADQVVDESAADGSRIPEVVHLDRGRAQRQDPRRRARGVALQVDEDVDAVVANARGHLLRGRRLAGRRSGRTPARGAAASGSRRPGRSSTRRSRSARDRALRTGRQRGRRSRGCGGRPTGSRSAGARSRANGGRAAARPPARRTTTLPRGAAPRESTARQAARTATAARGPPPRLRACAARAPPARANRRSSARGARAATVRARDRGRGGSPADRPRRPRRGSRSRSSRLAYSNRSVADAGERASAASSVARARSGAPIASSSCALSPAYETSPGTSPQARFAASSASRMRS